MVQCVLRSESIHGPIWPHCAMMTSMVHSVLRSESIDGNPVCLACTGFSHCEATDSVPASAKRPKIEQGRVRQ